MAHGVRKIRLTGGEPRCCARTSRALIEQLAALRTPAGAAAGHHAHHQRLAAGAQGAGCCATAGLRRVTVSLDGLDDAVFRRMNDVDFPVATCWRASTPRARAGAGEGQHGGQARHQRARNPAHGAALPRHGIVLRFIELHGRGATNGWRMDEVLPSADVVRRIRAEFALVQLEPSRAARPPSVGAMPAPTAGTTPRWAKSASSAA